MEKKNACMLLIRNKRDHKEDQYIGRWIILKWILERQNGEVWTG
jgi:hypothetical protein